MNDEADDEVSAELVSEGLTGGASLPGHVYLHVPFCRSKCSYCDFASVAGASDQQAAAVFEAMRAEVRRWSASGLPGVVDTIYVGGGTPSFLAAETTRLLDVSTRQLPVRDGAEITVEANPDSFDIATAEGFARAGATRVSLGVQSFDDSVLKILGRPHDAEKAAVAAAAALGAGLDLSVDLMCGVPGQSLASWQETLDRAVRSGAGHVSVYPLSVEEGTPLAVAVDAGLIEAPDPDDAATMMTLAGEILGRAGLTRYEVANYARPGKESRHNTGYWTGRSYLGIGPAAHGMLDAETARALGVIAGEDAEAGRDAGPDAFGRRRESRAVARTQDVASIDEVARVRYGNTPEVEAWLFGEQWEIELLTVSEAAREDVMLGLRMTRGVPVGQVDRAGLTPVLRDLAGLGLTEEADGRWRTTRRGWLLGNEVFSRVWAGQ